MDSLYNTKKPLFSIIIPVHNEEESVTKLNRKIYQIIRNENLGKQTEIIFVDDASTDNTFSKLKKIKGITVIRHPTNKGQTKALLSGILKSKGKTIITLDGDLQNDPSDIPNLIKRYNIGFDMVVGWRKNRLDPKNKTLPSRLARQWRKFLLCSPIKDSGCGLKIFSKKGLYGSLPKGKIHRFLPEIFLAKKLKVTQIPVTHHPRQYGKSHYGWKRLIEGFTDSLTVYCWKKWPNFDFFNRKNKLA